MGWKSDPYKYSVDELKELNIGDTKQQDQGCAYYLYDEEYDSKWAGFGWPDNGEFEWGGLGDGCAYCSWGRGKVCEGHDGFGGGGKPRVKRIAFKGDPTACCLANNIRNNQTYIVDGKTCDSRYRKPDSSECIRIMNEQCANDNIINKTECINWAYADGKNRLMKEYCNDSTENSRKEKCINWCKQNSTECTLLNTINDCVKYGLCDSVENCTTSKCSQKKSMDIQTKCKKYGLESEQGLRLGGCSKKAIEDFEEQCEKYDIDLDICAFTALENAKTLKLQAETAATSQAAIEKTRNSINQALGVTADISDIEEQQKNDLKEGGFLSSQTFGIDNSILIFILIAFFIILSSSSISLLFATGSKKGYSPQPMYYAPPSPQGVSK